MFWFLGLEYIYKFAIKFDSSLRLSWARTEVDMESAFSRQHWMSSKDRKAVVRKIVHRAMDGFVRYVVNANPLLIWRVPHRWLHLFQE